MSFKRLLLWLIFDFETHAVIIQNSIFTINSECSGGMAAVTGRLRRARLSVNEIQLKGDSKTKEKAIHL